MIPMVQCDMCGVEFTEDEAYRTYFEGSLLFIECFECHQKLEDGEDIDPPKGWGEEERKSDELSTT